MLAVGVGLFAWRGPLAPAWGSHGPRLGAGPSTASAASPATAPATTSSTPGSAATSTPPSTPAPNLPVDITAAGTRSVTDSDGVRVVTLDLRSADGSAAIRIDLSGSANASGGVILTSGDVTVTLGSVVRWNGPVTALHDSTLTADLSGPDGESVTLSADLSIDGARQLVSSTVHLRSSTGGD